MKVLVVDDEPDMLKVITWSLNFQEPDWEVLTASEGEQALELVAQENPDIVLLDVAMPEMDGFEVLQEIRRFSDVPVIMVTVREGELDKVRGPASGRCCAGRRVGPWPTRSPSSVMTCGWISSRGR